MGIISSFLDGKQINNINAELFEEIISQNNNAVILDVRTSKEHHSERIPNSILIDFYQPDFITNIGKLDRSKSYFVYCHSGARSIMAANEMLKLGFENIYNLKNGITSWQGDVERG